MSTYVIHMIEMKIEYLELKRNQGTEITYESLCIQYD